jgi:hypothetical protein
MDPLHILPIVCPLVFLAGIVDAVAGGGGLITLPAYLLAGLPAHTAAATNKCSSTFGTLLSTVRYLRHGCYHRPTAALSVGCALAGSWLGAMLNLRLEEKYLYWFLLAALPVVALAILLKPDLGAEDRTGRYTPRQLMARCGVIALVLGCYDGFFGPGTGTFLLLALSGLCGFDLLTASGNTKLMNLASNLAAFFTFALHGAILWQVGLPAALCGVLGNYVGSGLALKNGAKLIRPMLLVVLALLAVRVVTLIG